MKKNRSIRKLIQFNISATQIKNRVKNNIAGSTKHFLLTFFLVLLICFCTSPSDSFKDENGIETVKIDFGKAEKVDDYPLFVLSYDSDYNLYGPLGSSSNNFQKLNGAESFSNSDKWGCTCFSILGNKGNIMMGRNFDFYNHAAMVLYTHPTNRYSSLSTVDIYYLGLTQNSTLIHLLNSSKLKMAPFFPFDGINEKGVSIALMAVPNANPPFNSSKVSLNSLEIIRLVLDYAASVDEAITLIEKHNYIVDNIPVHYLITDGSGKSAIVEFVDQKVNAIYNNEPFEVCTNFVVTNSSAPLTTNCWRYNSAYKQLKDFNGVASDTSAMKILKSVSQQNTMWSIVYNLSKKSMLISMGKNYGKSYSIALTSK